MNKRFFIASSFLIASFVVFAQHEQHNMANMKPEENRSQQRGARRIGPVVEYNLYVNDTTVNFTGKRRKALAINGRIPAPTLRFTEGDSAVIHVHNLLKEEVSIHWHGVLLPNEEDGVPYLNTRPIHAGDTYTFRFRIIQNGTLWYHSHTGMQEQKGLYGPLVFYPAVREPESGKMEEVLQITDWRDEKGGSILRSLRRRSEWYAIKKGAVQSWGEALVKGHFNDKVQMEWTRMPGADLSDIYYQKFLMHGKPAQVFEKYKKGDSVLLRVINGAAGSYFWLQYSGGKMRVQAADGNDVKPVEVDKLLIATAETYEIMIKIPDDKQYELRATAQDITGYASAFFGSGPQVKAKDIPKLDYIVLMNEMNKMTWMMKGMGMKMKMGLYMKMPEMDMNNMNGMQGMENMDNMNMEDMDMNNMPMNHSMADTTMNMDSVQQGNMEMDTMQHNMDSMKNMDMGNMDHTSMPGMQKKPAPKKTPAKKPASVTAPMKGMDHSKLNMGTPKKIPAKKTVPKKKPAPKKKDAMEGMDHSKMQGMKMKTGFRPTPSNASASPALVTSLYSANAAIVLSKNTMTDTVPDKNKQQPMNMQGHDMQNMQMDTVPRNKEQQNKQNVNMQGMQHGNMKGNNMGGMQGGMQANTRQRDTSRSYMLQTMMPKTPMTGFDFPPGNGNDVVLSYDMLRSDTMTALPKDRPWREININLSGNMQRYIWSINGKTLSEQDQKFLIRKGENVRVVFTNATMMEHPMHLHGHFFRIINNKGAYAPMKHTFNINAMATQVIEFAATEEKDWFLHCHTLSHMINGMATIFSYEGTTSAVQQEFAKEFVQFKREHGGQYYPWANAAFHSQGTFGTLVVAGRKLQFDGDWRWDYKVNYELEPRLQYFLDKRQYFSAFIGGEFQHFDKVVNKIPKHIEDLHVATAGLIYTLPFFINAEGRIDTKGRTRLQLRREDIPLTTRTRLDFFWNTDKEYGVTARYIVSRYLAISGNYDNEFGWGAGISIIY